MDQYKPCLKAICLLKNINIINPSKSQPDLGHFICNFILFRILETGPLLIKLIKHWRKKEEVWVLSWKCLQNMHFSWMITNYRLNKTSEEGLFVCSIPQLKKTHFFLVIFWLFCANQPEKYQFVVPSQVPFFSSTEWGLISFSHRTQSIPCRMIEKSLNET